MHSFDKGKYPPPIAQLISEAAEMELDAGKQNRDVARVLEVLDFAEAVSPRVVVDPLMALACQSGLWLLHQFLDRSHEISQRIDTPTGSFWHGIMHRLEGDYSNAKYWFRRVDEHPVFESLAAAAHATRSERFPDKINWDPYDYIDRCEAAIRGPTHDDPLLRRIGRIEWELLFDFSYQQAVGAWSQ
jgi:hypothetical protein